MYPNREYTINTPPIFEASKIIQDFCVWNPFSLELISIGKINVSPINLKFKLKSLMFTN